MAIGLFIVLAATALLVSVKQAYLAQDDEAQVQEAGRYTLDTVARAVRQASHRTWDTEQVAVTDQSAFDPDVIGLDSRSLRSRTPGIEAPLLKSVNGSDVLAIRFFGSGSAESGDGTMLNCAGFSTPSPSSDEMAADHRTWSIFYVAIGESGEPELYCKYQGRSSWTSQSIARGVESFQVLYGLDTDMDGFPNRLLNASAIDALDDEMVVHGANAVERATDRARKTHWKKVVAVKVAMLIRGTHQTSWTEPANGYALFGDMYANEYADEDLGVLIRDADLPKSQRGRLRRVFSMTIRLRNGVGEGVA
ncbi:PilW family protein [Noviherbaspirillum agri]